jgi:hypothetical protein
MKTKDDELLFFHVPFCQRHWVKRHETRQILVCPLNALQTSGQDKQDLEWPQETIFPQSFHQTSFMPLFAIPLLPYFTPQLAISTTQKKCQIKINKFSIALESV